MDVNFTVGRVRRTVTKAVAALILSSCVTVGPPTLPLSPGAEKVRVLDTSTIAKSGVDLSKCAPLGQVTIGPVAWNNANVMIQNETLTKGGDVFFGTAWTSGNLTTITGMPYRCAAVAP
jgi:hypothetical protein